MADGNKKMRILVTGGAGFLGSHLCEYLLRKGHKVICMDNCITGSRQNIAHLEQHPQFIFVRHDISEHISVEGELNGVMHLASPASPIDYQKIPIQTLKAGSLGTHNTLGLAKAKKARYLLASTSEVYGDPLVNPQPETYCGNVNCVGPRGCYDEGKRYAEALVMAYHRIHGVDTKIVRIFNTYGPRMRPDDGRVVPAFVNQAITGKPITVFGDGKQTRSFCYVSDLIEGMYRLFCSALNEPVNLGNPEEMNIIDFARKVLEVTGSRSRITFKPLPVDDPNVRRPDITLAKSRLDWVPTVSIEQGLKETIAYFEKSHKGNSE